MLRKVLAHAVGGLMIVATTAASASAASPAGGQCGGIAGLRCQQGLTCKLSPRPGSDRMGVCVGSSVPTACPRDFRPVCGRDGKTYPNECMLRNGGTALSHPGRC